MCVRVRVCARGVTVGERLHVLLLVPLGSDTATAGLWPHTGVDPELHAVRTQLCTERLEAVRPGRFVLEERAISSAPDEARLVNDEVRVVELVETYRHHAVHVLPGEPFSDRVAAGSLHFVRPLVPCGEAARRGEGCKGRSDNNSSHIAGYVRGFKRREGSSTSAGGDRPGPGPKNWGGRGGSARGGGAGPEA